MIATYLQELQRLKVENLGTCLHHKAHTLGSYTLIVGNIVLAFIPNGIGIIHQSLLATNANDVQIVGKSQTTNISGVCIGATCQDVLLILCPRNGKQRTRRVVYLRNIILWFAALGIYHRFATLIVLFQESAHGYCCLVVASVLRRGSECIYAWLKIGYIAVGCHLYIGTGKDVLWRWTY